MLVKLKELEENKTNLENALNDVGDYYTKNVSITIQLDTDARGYRLKHDGSPLDINKVALIGFLKLEIDAMEVLIQELIGGLK